MGFALQRAGVTFVVTSAAAAAAAAAAGGGGGGCGGGAIVGKILLHNFRKYFEYKKSTFHFVVMFVSVHLPTILHTFVIPFACPSLVLHHLPIKQISRSCMQ